MQEYIRSQIGRRPQSFKEMEDDLNFLRQLEDDLNFLKEMEDDLNYLDKWKMT